MKKFIPAILIVICIAILVGSGFVAVSYYRNSSYLIPSSVWNMDTWGKKYHVDPTYIVLDRDHNLIIKRGEKILDEINFPVARVGDGSPISDEFLGKNGILSSDLNRMGEFTLVFQGAHNRTKDPNGAK